MSGTWYYEWQLVPQGAGILTGNGLQASVSWASGREGTAAIMDRAMNDYDTSQWSAPHYTEVFTCLGLEELRAGNVRMKVYPNPGRGFVVSEAQAITGLTSGQTLNTTETAVSIVNIFGKTVAELPVTSEKTVWRTSGVKPGIYFYKLKIEGEVLSGKVVVQK